LIAASLVNHDRLVDAVAQHQLGEQLDLLVGVRARVLRIRHDRGQRPGLDALGRLRLGWLGYFTRAALHGGSPIRHTGYPGFKAARAPMRWFALAATHLAADAQNAPAAICGRFT
jgi:hypothetical protein